jgi:hypothetical protein
VRDAPTWDGNKAKTRDGYSAQVRWSDLGRSWRATVHGHACTSSMGGHKTEAAARVWCDAEIEVFRNGRDEAARRRALAERMEGRRG